FAAFLSFAIASASAQSPRILREPSMSATRIAFVYADDIWTVPRDGGEARRLTSTANVRSGPCFSPDGKLIAYSAHVGGNDNTYVISADGGAARQITSHPAGDSVVGWTPDGQNVTVISDRVSFNDFARLFTVPVSGKGLPQLVKLPSVDQASYSPDGSLIAYTPFNQWQALSWKRYRGGQTEPIWIVDAKSFDVVKVPRENSNDRYPVWADGSVYFLSDRSGPVTLFRYDPSTRKVEQVVENQGLDLKSLSAGPGGLVYAQFGSSHIYDLAAKREHEVPIQIDGDLPQLQPAVKAVRPDEIQNFNLSPTGKRAVFEAHGEIFTVPAEKGDVRDLTNTSDAAEREPAWSPDGKRIAYFSDASGEYKLYIRDQDGIAPPQIIDLGSNPTYYYAPHWSPDSKRILFGDKRLNLWLVDADGKSKPIKVATDDYEGFSAPSLDGSFSPDGKWILYRKTLHNLEHAAFLYSLDTHQSTQVSDGMSDVAHPLFDPSGKYVYFTASTDIGPAIDGFNLSALNRTTTASVYVVVLGKDLPSPVPPESDDEKAAAEEKKADADADKRKAEEEKKAGSKPGDTEKKDTEKKDQTSPKLPEMKVDLEGIEQRTVALPIPARNYVSVAAAKTGVLLLGEGTAAAQTAADGPQNMRSVWKFTLEKRQVEDVLHNVDGFTVSFDGAKVLYKREDNWAIADVDELKPGAADSSPGKALRVTQMQARIDPRAEWRQMYHETWRIEREFLYDPNAHGLDLQKAEKKYAVYLDGLGARSELTALQEEMLGEITIGHMFVRGPHDPEHFPKTGLLGADYTLDQNRYRFAHVLVGESWNPSLRAPLAQPGVAVKDGEYLLSVNGVPLFATDNVYSRFEGLADKQVVIEVGPTPDGKGSRRLTVVPVDSEHRLRAQEWIASNIRRVDELSGGQVAYVYLPNTAGSGFNNFNRYFFAQTQKKAVVIDERYNEGGLIADYVIDVLRRVPMSNYETREGDRVTEPSGAIFGPKAMIINQSAGSGGDAMPWYFRKASLGPLVGTRTWGGLVGIGGYPSLLDGGGVTAPRTAIYGLQGEFEVENHGIAPDVEVENLPKDSNAGHDPQLERAVSLVLEQLKSRPPATFPAPPYPNYHQNDDLGRSNH
ncbi:MAG: peptidase, partial [Acidobacteriaceae bacterium]|nr:peptidase [Acidobacteriaceae bacterium]